jgi:hypothetical protein
VAYGPAMSDRVVLARAIAARSNAAFIEIKRERKRRAPPFTADQLLALKQGKWAERERERLVRQWDEQ